MSFSLHPAIDNGITKGNSSFSGGKLQCLCSTNKVEVTLKGNVAHNHACGCSKCWKPEGALFSIVGVVPVDNLSVTANKSKLDIVDKSATIQRHACKDCGAHLYGRIETDHPFKGLDFVHVELSSDKGWQEPQFAAFVSSIIEQGFHPKNMDSVRANFKELGLDTYDCLSPPLMDLIATSAGQKASKLPAKLCQERTFSDFGKSLAATVIAIVADIETTEDFAEQGSGNIAGAEVAVCNQKHKIWKNATAKMSSQTKATPFRERFPELSAMQYVLKKYQ